jgi:uncharacterized membrane protein
LLKLGALYFAVVFTAGFVLGTIRTFWLVPLLGVRLAELAEAPIMLVVVVLSARLIVRRHAELRSWGEWLGVGLLALALMLLVEFTAVLWLRGLSLEQYFATLDPVSGTVYYVLLALFAILPALVSWRRGSRGSPV